jgi:osmotically-inducible protein OsmY
MNWTMRNWIGLGMLPGVVLSAGLAGCKSSAVGGDAQLTSTIQTQIAADSALAGQQVSVSVQGGVATLNGTMNNDGGP